MNVALYVRVSTSDQYLKGYSVPEQTDRLTKYCESQGWTVFKVYTDAGFTGTNMRRPALQDLISDIKRIDKVVVYKLDRLSRSQRDTLTLIEDIFIPNNTDLVSMNESFDTSTPFGRFMIGILSTFAQLEKNQISERMTMGKYARAKEGKWHGGLAPLGYKYEDGQLIVDEYVARQIREIYDRYLEGEPLRSIERDFKSKGITHQYGYWSPKQMRRTMSNKVNIGLINAGQETVKGLHQPIIDEDTFKKAQVKLLQRHKEFEQSGIKTGQKGNSTLLGGLLFCSHCGARYGKAKSGTKKYGLHDVYKCYSRHKKVKSMIKDSNCKNKTYKVDELDRIVIDQITSLTLEDIQDIASKKDTHSEREVLEIEKKSVESQIERFMKLYALGRYDIDTLDRMVLPLEEKKLSLQSQLNSLSDDSMSSDEAVEVVENLGDVFEVGSFKEKRAIIESLIEKIEIDGEDLTIFWKFS